MRFSLRSAVICVSFLINYAPAVTAQSNWSFKPAETRYTEPARNYDLIHLRVDLRFDERNKTFAGEAINTITPLFNGVTSARFDAVGLEIESVTLEGKSLQFQQFEDAPRKGIEIDLGRSYGESDTLAIAIKYSGKNPEKGLYFIQPDDNNPQKPYQIWTQGEDMDTRYWIPTYDYPNDRTATEFFFTVREPLTLVSNGRLLETLPAGKDGEKTWRTFHWRMDQPYVTYLIAIAAADWEKYTDTVKLAGRAQPLAVEYYVNRGVGEATARRSYEETPRMIQFFSEKIGVPFPWDKYAQATVTDFVVGGMENVSITLNTDRTLHDERAHLDTSSRGLVAHELAHQWWGDYLTCRRWADLWLNEGFATYFQCLYEREAEGEDAFRIAMRGNQQSARNSDPKDNPRPIVETFIDPNHKGRGNAIYVKGASVLYMLHRMLGEELWWKAIHHYASKHAFGIVDTHNFEIAIREATGKNLDWFFQQWVYLGGWPEFEVAQEWSGETKQLKLSVKQTQKAEGLRPIFRVPIEIAIATQTGIQNYSVWCDAPEQNFYFPCNEKPLLVKFDKDSIILKTLKFDRPLEMLRYQLANDTDIVGRVEAAEALSEKKDEATESIPALIQALQKDKAHQVRAAAAIALGKIGKPAGQTALLNGLTDEKSAVRRHCADALASIPKSEDAIAKLEFVFQMDLSYNTQAAAMKALAKLAPERAGEYAARGLAMPSHRDQIAVAAIELIAEKKDFSAFEKLRGYLGGAHSDEIQRAAVAACARIGKEAKEKERAEIVDALLEFGEGRKKDSNRTGIVNALATVGDKKAIPFLEKIAAGDYRRQVKEAAQRSLDQLKGEKKKEEPKALDAESLKKEIEKLKQQLESIEKRVPVEASTGK